MNISVPASQLIVGDQLNDDYENSVVTGVSERDKHNRLRISLSYEGVSHGWIERYANETLKIKRTLQPEFKPDLSTEAPSVNFDTGEEKVYRECSTPPPSDRPFRLKGNKLWGYEVIGVSGVCICHITGTLIDGGNTKKWPDSIIRTRDERHLDAHWVLAALNAYNPSD
jgi:hypothetical protein